MSRAFVHASGAHTPESLALRQVPVRTASVRPVSAWTVQLQRGDRCACGGGCPRCQESSGFQTRLAVNHPGDLWEQEADRIAEAVVDTPEPLADPAIVAASGGSAVAPQHRQTAPSLPEQPQPVVFASEPQPDMPPAEEGTEERAAGALAQHVLRSSGSPLDAATRALVERRFGHDFQQVRVHTDAAAQELARLAHAKALTWGPHIVFGSGEYAPTATEGHRLLAHELVHTIQQEQFTALRTPSPMVFQRQPQPGSPSATPLTAQTIFPFPLDSQIALDQVMDENLLKLLASQRPQIAATFRVLGGRRATVRISTPERFEAVLNEAVSLPGSGEEPAVTYRNVTVRLRRSAAGTFDFEVVAQTGTEETPLELFVLRDLTATRRDRNVVLSSGTGAAAVPQLGVVPRGENVLDLRVFTAPYLDQVPEFLRGAVPAHIDVISLTELPPASAGSAAIEQAAAEAESRARSRRRPRRQEFRVGVGGQFGDETRLVLSTAWQYSFEPITSAGSLFQVPLRVQLQYAPPDSVLAAISSGVGTSLPLKVPVNLRLLAGVAAGAVPGPSEAGSPLIRAAGPTLGVGAGVELGRWRINLDYEHVVNLVEASPDLDTFLLSGGVSF